MVRALAFHQCGLGSIPGPGIISGLSLLVLYSFPRGFSPLSLQNKLQKLQNKAVRVLTYSNKRATMFYKSMHVLAWEYLSSKFERREPHTILRTLRKN